jgi:alpha-ribazole phosphatase
MKFYFIRHWKTEFNLTGKMVKNYDNVDIVHEKPEGWEEKVGKYIPKRDYILTSPVKRCIQTCELIFNKKPLATLYDFGEFDCSGIGKRKFWEMTEKEFEKYVPLTSEDMEKRANVILNTMPKCLESEHITDCIVISHGMLIRYLYHYLTGNKNISPFKVINSEGFSFSNLDLMIYDTNTKEIEIHRYQEPINHFSR